MTGPVPGPAGGPALLAARARLVGVLEQSPEEQVASFDAVHTLLQDALAALDEPGA